VRGQARTVLQPRVALRPRPLADDALAADGHGPGQGRALGDRAAGSDPQLAAPGLQARAVPERRARADDEPRARLGAQHDAAPDPHAGLQLDARPAPRAPQAKAGAPAGARGDHGIGAHALHVRPL
jgi:hypothetical protein